MTVNSTTPKHQWLCSMRSAAGRLAPTFLQRKGCLSCTTTSPPLSCHPRRLTVRVVRVWLSLAALTLVVPKAAIQGMAEEITPPFVARGTVLRELFRADATGPFYSSAGDFSFLLSNTFWQVDITVKSPPEIAGSRESCRRIPDGIRYFTIPAPNHNTDTAVVGAHAEALDFPPTEHLCLLACWLSLTPNPALPVLGPSRMKRFLFTDQMKHPQNQGTYAAAYISRDHPFLSVLTITNDGWMFPLGSKPTRYEEPYASGFLETEYKVLNTTNCSGIVFPSRCVLRRLAAKPGSKDPALYTTSQVTLDVRSVEVATADPLSPTGIPLGPARVFAMDRRPAGLPTNLAVNHIVTNDQWVSVTNRQLAELATITRGMRKRHATAHPVYLVFFLLAAVVAPGAAIWIRNTRSTKTPKQ